MSQIRDAAYADAQKILNSMDAPSGIVAVLRDVDSLGLASGLGLRVTLAQLADLQIAGGLNFPSPFGPEGESQNWMACVGETGQLASMERIGEVRAKELIARAALPENVGKLGGVWFWVVDDSQFCKGHTEAHHVAWLTQLCLS
jgi:hypothetical protein